ncbi:hypothetical protein TrVFT333_010667 [Trichoderma virens FT-333]|nr:hypothetical protein TrVFT333_010667 [Trichoderma virens FT-333]
MPSLMLVIEIRYRPALKDADQRSTDHPKNYEDAKRIETSRDSGLDSENMFEKENNTKLDETYRHRPEVLDEPVTLLFTCQSITCFTTTTVHFACDLTYFNRLSSSEESPKAGPASMKEAVDQSNSSTLQEPFVMREAQTRRTYRIVDIIAKTMGSTTEMVFHDALILDSESAMFGYAISIHTLSYVDMVYPFSVVVSF